MGNTVGPNGLSIGSRRHVSSSKYPRIVVHEDEPNVLVHLAHAHLLSRKHLTEIHLSAFEAEAAARGDGAGPIVQRVVELAEAAIRAV